MREKAALAPLALIFPNFFGVMGVYYAEPVADTISALTPSILFLCNIKKNLTMENLKKIK